MVHTSVPRTAGAHIDSTVLANALAQAGYIDQTTGEPLTEAMVLGIAGGIGAGLGFCPSILRYGLGAGISVVARNRSGACHGDFQKLALDRLGIAYEVAEASSDSAGLKKLVAALDAEHAVLVQCSKGLPYYGGTNKATGVTAWAWSVNVASVDPAAATARVGDLAPDLFEVSLDALAQVRGQTCTHKRRLFALPGAPGKLTRKALVAAVRAGLTDCVDSLQNPRIKSFGLGAWETWARNLANTKAKSGWLRTFPGGKLMWALRDVFRSIETDNTGGQLMRPLFADFLDRAAPLVRRKKLHACADTYRELGNQWQSLAETALPDQIAACKKYKQVERKRVALMRSQGPKALAQLRKLHGQSQSLRAKMSEQAPPAAQASDLLATLSAQVSELHAAERRALAQLAAAVA